MKEIVIKNYLSSKDIENNEFVLSKSNTAKKIGFYGILFTLLLAYILLGKTKNQNDNSSIDNDDCSSYNKQLINLNMSKSMLLSINEVTKTSASSSKPRTIDDVSHEELVKIDDGIYNTGKKINCLDDTYYANLTYIEYYLAHPGITYENAIIEVNMGLWKPFYSFTTIDGSDFDKHEVLLNKYSKINQERYNDDFDVSTLEKVGKTDFLLQSEAHDACERMIKEASKNNIKLTIASAFVSYKDQEKQYTALVKKVGKEAAELVIERPGHSYAQIGIKIVFKVKKGSDISKWLYKNAYKYGFVYFAPSGKTRITGYTYNPGAFIYVGTKYAKICHDKKMSFDEVWHRFIFPGCVTYSIAEDEYAYFPTTNDNIYMGKSKIYEKKTI